MINVDINQEIKNVLEELQESYDLKLFLDKRYQKFTTLKLSKTTKSLPFLGTYTGFDNGRYAKDGELLIFQMEYVAKSNLNCYLQLGPARYMNKREKLFQMAVESLNYKGEFNPNSAFTRLTNKTIIEKDVIIEAENGLINSEDFRNLLKRKLIYYIEESVSEIEDIYQNNSFL